MADKKMDVKQEANLPTKEKIKTLELNVEELGYYLPELSSRKYSIIRWSGLFLILSTVFPRSS